MCEMRERESPRNVHTYRLSAAKQGWRCAVCRELLDETYEIDHIKALWRGGSNDISNLQALCKRDHVWKSAVLDQRS